MGPEDHRPADESPGQTEEADHRLPHTRRRPPAPGQAESEHSLHQYPFMLSNCFSHLANKGHHSVGLQYGPCALGRMESEAALQTLPRHARKRTHGVMLKAALAAC